MELHDKDLDRLFRTGLQDWEEEPSAGTWNKIAAGLNKPAAKRSLIPYLRIAASVLILLGAGTWVLLKQPKTVVKQNRHTQMAAHITKYSIDTKQQQLYTHTAATSYHKQPGVVAATQGTTVEHPLKKFIKHEHNDDLLRQQSEQPQLAALDVPSHTALTQPVVPDEILATQQIEDRPVFKSITALPVAQTLASAPAVKAKVKKHGIHSLGDVVNLVVAKVDKRSDKVIEFTDTDDDGAVITGINLGLFSIKKEQ